VARSKTSRSWMQRHVADPYVRRAKALGYRSRAAFKLLEIDARDRLFAAGQVVVDLGAAPGGWSQVAAERTGPGGLVVAVDLLDMPPLPGVAFVRGDFTADAVRRELEQALAGRPADLVLSDLAPNLSGVAATDAARSIALAAGAVEFAAGQLKPGGALLVKTFQGAGFPALLADVRARFAQVASRKPEASRSRSSEMYLLARGPRRDGPG
jgi:23S rRNA (uridine2552-2'-O)-methyltransferase